MTNRVCSYKPIIVKKPDGPFSGRCAHALAYSGTKAYLTGGDDGSELSDAWETSDAGLNWALLTSSASWGGRKYHSSVFYSNKLWIIGGLKTGSSRQKDIWSMTTNDNNWTLVNSNLAFGPRSAHTTEIFLNSIVVICGEGNEGSGDAILSSLWNSSDGSTFTLLSTGKITAR